MTIERPCLSRFNARFGVPARQPGLAYRPAAGLNLDGVLCFKYQRTVAKDNTLRFDGHTLQLLPGLARPSYTKARVEVQERLDGRLVVCYQGQVIATREAPLGPVTLRARNGLRGLPAEEPSLGPKRPIGQTAHPPKADGAKPRPDHPWRKSGLLTKSLNH